MKEFKSNLIDKIAYIKDSIHSIWAGEWGRIKYYDGDHYHIAIWEGNEQPIFSRNEFTVPKNQNSLYPNKREELPMLITDNLTDDEKHNFKDFTPDEQKLLLDPKIALDKKVVILEIVSFNHDYADDDYACYLCKCALPTQELLRTHIKVHLSRMGALKFFE